MTGGQLQRLLDSAGLSQRGAARELQVSERQMRRYVAGDAEVPRVIEYALRWLIHISER
jgi:predicted DNA-binding protein (UPF0251 family)